MQWSATGTAENFALSDALFDCLMRDASWQQHLQHCVAARLASRGLILPAPSQQVPVLHIRGDCTAHARTLPHNQEAHQQLERIRRVSGGVDSHTLQWHAVPLDPLEVLWTLDVYVVAQTSPGTAAALLGTPGTVVNASAGAALRRWMLIYAKELMDTATQGMTRVRGGACGGADGCDSRRGEPQMPPALERQVQETSLVAEGIRQTHCVACVLLLRIPTAYTILCTEDTTQRHVLSLRGGDRLLHHAATASPTPTYFFFYPSVAFRSAASPPVHVVGVVHGVRYASRAATEPAPWVSLLLLQPCHPDTPTLCEVDLTGFPVRVTEALAVLGAVVELRGAARVARCRRRRGEEVCHTQCIVASWAAVLLAPPSPRASAAAAVCTAPFDGAAAPRSVWSSGAVGSVPYGEHMESVGDANAALVEGLPDLEEEAAARVALGGWEGARLALGLQVDAESGTVISTPVFAASLDVVVAAQLTFLSAQLPDGVVTLLLDAVPESLMRQMRRALRAVLPPTAVAVHVAGTALRRAKPSLFLPSYKVHRDRQSAGAPLSSGRPAAMHGDFQRSSSGGGVGAFAAPPPDSQQPAFLEELSGGVLTRAAGRALVLRAIEGIPLRTLHFLRDALRPRSGAEEAAKEAAAAPAALLQTEGGIGGRSPLISLEDEDAESAAHHRGEQTSTWMEGSRRHTVQREGGQAEPYRVAHAALCTVRDGNAMATRSHLFEFAQRCDVVLQPAFTALRQSTAVYATATAPFQSLLQSRRAVWLRLLGAVLAIPTALDEEVQRGEARRDAPPTVSEPCSRLLSLYFMAATAVCPGGTDSSMMSTLVKLTLAHAQWRCRLTHLQAQGERRSQQTSSPPSSTAASVTALIDAVVAVALCDTTLCFFTATTLLGESLFQLLEREAWPAQTDASHSLSAHEPSQEEIEEALAGAVPPHILPAVLHLYETVVVRTRVENANLPVCHGAQTSTGFSICGLVSNMVEHLERLIQGSAAPEGP